MEPQQKYLNLLAVSEFFGPVLEVDRLRLRELPVEVICHQKIPLGVFDQKL